MTDFFSNRPDGGMFHNCRLTFLKANLLPRHTFHILVETAFACKIQQNLVCSSNFSFQNGAMIFSNTEQKDGREVKVGWERVRYTKSRAWRREASPSQYRYRYRSMQILDAKSRNGLPDPGKGHQKPLAF